MSVHAPTTARTGRRGARTRGTSARTRRGARRRLRCGGEVWHFELLLLTRANSLAALSAMARLSWSRATSNRFSLTSPSRQFGWDQFSGSVRSARLRDGGVPGRRTSGRGRAELQRVLGSWSAGGAELLGRSLSTLPALTDAT